MYMFPLHKLRSCLFFFFLVLVIVQISLVQPDYVEPGYSEVHKSDQSFHYSQVKGHVDVHAHKEYSHEG